MDFYVGDKVRTKQKVTQRTKDILVANEIKPGEIGVVTKIIVTVKFKGKEVMLDEDALDAYYEKSKNVVDDGLDLLKDMFGFK